MSDEPVLPPELERLIFEMFAEARPVSIPILMRVAKRVKIWVEPFLYRTITLCRNPHSIPRGYLVFQWTRLLDTNPIRSSPSPARFPGSTVRHLLIQSPNVEYPLRVLSACTFVENLWIYPALDLLRHIEAMPLKRLHCDLTTLFEPGVQPDFTCPLFSRLTHLEIFENLNGGLPLHSYEQLSLIRTLTHLAFYDTRFLSLAAMHWLRDCAALRVLVVLVPESLYVGNIPVVLLDDIRFVEVPGSSLVDWVIGAHTGNDYWSRAEELIAKRASGAVDRHQCWVGRI